MTPRMKTWTWMMFAVLLFTFGAAAGAGCDSVDAAFDCESVCSRYRDCFDSSYDVSKCRSNCRDRSANDDSVRHAADTCEACIDDMSCASATFNCAGSCSNIVP
jgi:hypothetical protein